MLTGTGAIGGLASAVGAAGAALFESDLVNGALVAGGVADAGSCEAGAARDAADLLGAVDGVDALTADLGDAVTGFPVGVGAVGAFAACAGAAFFAGAFAGVTFLVGVAAFLGGIALVEAAVFATVFFEGAGLLKRFSWPPKVARLGDGKWPSRLFGRRGL